MGRWKRTGLGVCDIRYVRRIRHTLHIPSRAIERVLQRGYPRPDLLHCPLRVGHPLDEDDPIFPEPLQRRKQRRLILHVLVVIQHHHVVLQDLLIPIDLVIVIPPTLQDQARIRVRPQEVGGERRAVMLRIAGHILGPREREMPVLGLYAGSRSDSLRDARRLKQLLPRRRVDAQRALAGVAQEDVVEENQLVVNEDLDRLAAAADGGWLLFFCGRRRPGDSPDQLSICDLPDRAFLCRGCCSRR